MAKLPIFAERLAELKGGMSAPEFATVISVSRQTVNFYLRGERIPDAETLCRICERCGVSADWLLGIPGPAVQKEKTMPTADELETVTNVLLAVTDCLCGETETRKSALDVIARELTGLSAEEVVAISKLSGDDRAFLSQMVLALAGKRGDT